MDVLFSVNRVSVCSCVAQFYKINVGGHALLKTRSALWAHLPTSKYNTMNHFSVMPRGRADISASRRTW